MRACVSKETSSRWTFNICVWHTRMTTEYSSGTHLPSPHYNPAVWHWPDVGNWVNFNCSEEVGFKIRFTVCGRSDHQTSYRYSDHSGNRFKAGGLTDFMLSRHPPQSPFVYIPNINQNTHAPPVNSYCATVIVNDCLFSQRLIYGRREKHWRVAFFFSKSVKTLLIVLFSPTPQKIRIENKTTVFRSHRSVINDVTIFESLLRWCVNNFRLLGLDRPPSQKSRSKETRHPSSSSSSKENEIEINIFVFLPTLTSLTTPPLKLH